MILPGKHLRHDRALLGVGGDILAQLDGPKTVSELWERMQLARGESSPSITFDWFILSLSFLYSIAAVEYDRGIVTVKVRR